MSDLPEVYRKLAGSFEEGAAPAPLEEMTLEEVTDFVRRHVERLLERNPGMLMSILYRIDVAEAQVQEVMGTARHDEIAQLLAELIVQRQLQKVHLRREYNDRDGY